MHPKGPLAETGSKTKEPVACIKDLGYDSSIPIYRHGPSLVNEQARSLRPR
jgi:hypothetical protein